jgi:hypothetical protein
MKTAKSYYVPKNLTTAEHKARLGRLVSGREMAKPVKPVKPNIPKPTRPSNVEIIICYAWEHEGSGDIEFFGKDMGADREWDNEVDKYDFYQDWRPLDSITVKTLQDFADCVDVKLEDVEAYPWYSDQVCYKTVKQIPSMEFSAKLKAFSELNNNREDAFREYNRLMRQYTFDKIEWDLHQSKLEMGLERANDED